MDEFRPNDVDFGQLKQGNSQSFGSPLIFLLESFACRSDLCRSRAEASRRGCDGLTCVNVFPVD
jgi:hypothetical protein